MIRRRFLTAVGSAIAWPVVSYAQQPTMPVIGFLSTASPGQITTLMTAFREGLAGGGYVEGRNVAIEYRWAEGRYDRLPALAADLVRRNVAVIAATGGLVSAQAAKGATSTIPVLFIAGFDPVEQRLVASFNRPGGNATGVSVFTVELGRKRLELLRELIPMIAKIAMLVNPHAISTGIEIKDLEVVTSEAKLQLLVLEARTDHDLDAAFGEGAKRGVDAVLVSADSFFTTRRNRIVALAARHALPASYPWPQYAQAGGLISYGTPLTWAYRQIGEYAGRILKGVNPADLPVQAPTRYELVINLKTAKALGLEVPPTLLARADEVIE